MSRTGGTVLDSWEGRLEFCVENLGEEIWLFAFDWPHGDTAWPEAVEQSVERRPEAAGRERDAPRPAAAVVTRARRGRRCR